MSLDLTILGFDLQGQGAMLLPALIAAVSLAGLLLVGGRDPKIRTRLESLREMHGSSEQVGETLVSEVERRWYHRVGEAIGASPLVGEKERSKVALTLAGAGIRGNAALAVFIAVKFTTFAITAGAIWFVMEWRGLIADKQLLRLAPVLLGGVLGWRLPDMIVGFLARRRRMALENGLPDALDLLVICAEAGLALDNGLARVSRDLESAHVVLSREIAICVAEMRVMPDRRAALENLAARSGLASIRSVVATLSQTIKYGTPLAQSLRVLAAEMRSARVLRFEERAARLPALLTVPLIVFILPCLFIVVAGPAVLDVLVLMNK